MKIMNTELSPVFSLGGLFLYTIQQFGSLDRGHRAYYHTQKEYIISQDSPALAITHQHSPAYNHTPHFLLLQNLPLSQQVPHNLQIMPKNQPRPKHPHQRLHHFMTMQPRALIPHQPPLRRRILVVLANVVLVRREHERPVARQVDLHEAEARRVPGAVAQGDALAELEGRGAEGLPVEGCQGEVGGEVDAAVGFGGDGPGGVFKLLFVDVDFGEGG